MILDPLQPFFDHRGALILDGGLATELEKRGADLQGHLWSARLLLDNAGLVREVHAAYLEAGADCLVSASYQATVEGFLRRGVEEAEARRLLRRSVELAVVERDAFWARRQNRGGRLRPLVAASVGPYGAYLGDGSEYTGRYHLDAAGLRRFHALRWRELASAGADLMACETIPNHLEARVLAELIAETPEVPAWISFSCPDGCHLADGSDLQTVVGEIADTPGLLALGVNCVAPSLVQGLLSRLRAATDKPLVAYPNSGESWDSEEKSWSAGPEVGDLGIAGLAWHKAGARLLGGCCRTGPADIRRLRLALAAARRGKGLGACATERF